MNISKPFIERPVMTALLTLTLVILGWVGYRALPISALPRMDLPVISVSAALPGASAEVIASAVTSPLERQLATIPGIDTISSKSALGRASITIQFRLDVDINAAAQDVESALSVAQRQLPKEMPAPPTYLKLNPALSPILFMAMTSETQSLVQLNDIAENVIVPRLSAVPGVAQIMILGSQRFAVRIQVDPNELAARGIGLDQLKQAVAAASSTTPAGTIESPSQSFVIDVGNQPRDASSYRDVIVAHRAGQPPVRLSEVATLFDSVEVQESASFAGDKKVILLAVQRQPTSNAVAVVDEVRKAVHTLGTRVPAGVKIEELFDQTTSVRDSVADVQFTLALTIGLVVLVIFLFLKRLTATLVPAVALPVTLVATFMTMWAMGFSLNNISLLALTLSIGFVVDDAIVMVENVMRHIEEGKKPMQAAIEGAREVGFTIISITMSLIMVFVPVVFMGGTVGKLFHEFGVTISLAILFSGIISVTLTPCLAAYWLRPEKQRAKPLLFDRIMDGLFDGLLAGYRVTLDFGLRHPALVMLLMISSFVATGYMMAKIPKGFFPTEDTGYISATTESRSDISYGAMLQMQQEAAAIISKHPDVVKVTSIIGVNEINSSLSSGRLFVQLRKRPEPRHKTVLEVIDDLRTSTAAVPGLMIYFQPVQSLQTSARVSKAKYQVNLQGTDIDEVQQWATKLEDRMKAEKIYLDLSSDSDQNTPRLVFTPNVQRMTNLGVTADVLRQTLYTAFGGAQAASIYTSASSYKVILELKPEHRTRPEDIENLTVRSSDGKQVPLSSFGRVVVSGGAALVAHLGELPVITLSFNLSDATPLSHAVSEIERLRNEIDIPAGITLDLGGDAKAFAAGMSGEGLLLLAALFAVYVILGILYESLIHPVTILAGLPSAALGAVGTLALFHRPLDVIGMIGILMLIGIVKKNAIMIVDFALQRKAEGVTDPHAAVREACLLRFRPIMMTTLAAILGAVPIAMGTGAGAELRQPLGLAVVGGLLVSQVVTLYVTPVLFLLFETLSQKVNRLFGAKAPVVQEEAKPAEAV